MRSAEHSLTGAAMASMFLALGTVPEGLRGPGTALALGPNEGAAMATFFVSPQGNDRWSGRLAEPDEDDGPFATVARAQQAVRALLSTLTPRRPVRVVVRGGTYYLDEALTFGPEDSGAQDAPVAWLTGWKPIPRVCV